MMRILFVLLGDQSKASSRVRGFWMAEALEKLGVVCNVVYGHRRRDLLRSLPLLPFHDVVIFQKNCSRWHVRLMKIANALGKKTLYDLDDAPSRINSPVTVRNSRRMMTQASAVVVGSQILLDYVREFQPNSFLLPTSIKLDNYVPFEQDGYREPVCLGWIGNGDHYGKDLVEILQGPLRIIGADQQVRFHIIGACGNKQLYDAFSHLPGVETVFIDQIKWSNPEAVLNHLQEFDIGLYPVLDNEFNRHKCGFKALEYMAIQIPVIASPVGELREIIKNGAQGFLAASENDWVESISLLNRNTRLRKKMGLAGRARIEADYDIARTADLLLDIITRRDILQQ